MPDRQQLALERSIASLHRALWRAEADAEALGAASLVEDLRQIMCEVTRLGADLTNRRPVSCRQLSLHVPDRPA